MAQARIPVPGATDPLGTLTLTAAVAQGIAAKGKDSLIAFGGEWPPSCKLRPRWCPPPWPPTKKPSS